MKQTKPLSIHNRVLRLHALPRGDDPIAVTARALALPDLQALTEAEKDELLCRCMYEPDLRSLIRDAGADWRRPGPRSRAIGATPILAERGNDQPFLEEVLAEVGMEPLLHEATVGSFSRTASSLMGFLLDRGLSPTKAKWWNRRSKESLCLLVGAGLREIRSGEVAVNARAYDDMPLLHHATVAGMVDEVAELVQQHGADPTIRTWGDSNPMATTIGGCTLLRLCHGPRMAIALGIVGAAIGRYHGIKIPAPSLTEIERQMPLIASALHRFPELGQTFATLSAEAASRLVAPVASEPLPVPG